MPYRRGIYFRSSRWIDSRDADDYFEKQAEDAAGLEREPEEEEDSWYEDSSHIDPPEERDDERFEVEDDDIPF